EAARGRMANAGAPEWQDKAMRATLMLGENALMGADTPSATYEAPRGFSISLNMNNPADADRVFNPLAAQGKIVMPIQQTFWAARFGMLVDRFGIPWMV